MRTKFLDGKKATHGMDKNQSETRGGVALRGLVCHMLLIFWTFEEEFLGLPLCITDGSIGLPAAVPA